MTILKERHLQLSRKKTCIGSIEAGFHFLGINYLESQSPGSTNRTQDIREMAVNDPLMDDYCLLFNQTGGGNNNSIKPNQEYPEPIAIVPHARTIRKAREQVRLMVTDGFSIPRIRSYLTAWSRWWVRTSQVWSHQTLLIQFIRSCYDPQIAGIGAEILLVNLRKMVKPAGMMAQSDWQETV